MIKFTLLFLLICINGFAQTGGQLPAWQEGFLDIHYINTGRGDACFMVLPDGTTLQVDAGDMSDTDPRTTSRRNAERAPNASKTAPGWIADYIDQFRPQALPRQLDYALITHYHDDHFGVADSLRQIAAGGYQLFGIPELGTLIPIKTLIDRGFSFPIDLKSEEVQSNPRMPADWLETLKEYWKFIDYQQNKGMQHEELQVGSRQQIVLKNKPQQFPGFSVHNIASNGRFYTGYADDDFHSIFIEGEYPGENPLSNGIRIDYGKFNYFTGGDIAGIDGIGQADFSSVEAQVAPVIGPVDVATLNHHGNRDSQSPYYVRTIRPRVWIQQNWTADHPGEEVFRRISSTELYPGERDIFSTILLQGTKDVIGGSLDRYKSQQGHIVVRVHPGGDQYEIFVLNDKTEKREITSHFGPYVSR